MRSQNRNGLENLQEITRKALKYQVEPAIVATCGHLYTANPLNSACRAMMGILHFCLGLNTNQAKTTGNELAIRANLFTLPMHYSPCNKTETHATTKKSITALSPMFIEDLIVFNKLATLSVPVVDIIYNQMP